MYPKFFLKKNDIYKIITLFVIINLKIFIKEGFEEKNI